MTEQTENIIDATLRELAEARATVRRCESLLVEFRGKLVGIRAPRTARTNGKPKKKSAAPRTSTRRHADASLSPSGASHPEGGRAEEF